MATVNQIQKALAGLEDLLVGQGTVNQTRAGTSVVMTKLNGDNIPYSGDTATGDLVSLVTKINSLASGKISNGNLALSVTGGTRVLTTTEFDNISIDISGTLTANQVIEIPDGIPTLFIVDNLTTGAFTLTIKHNATTGVLVSQGQRTLLYTTGTQVEAITQLQVAASDVSNVPSGGITETDVQGALDGLEARKLDASSTIGGFVGQIKLSAMGTVPSGHLECDGAAVSRTTYASLFSQIGTIYGSGDGSTTFNIPNLQGEFVRGWDNGRGVDTGRGIGTTQAEDFKSHTHSYSHATTAAASGSPGAGVGGIAGATSGATGGSETRPRNVALMYVIQY